MRDVIIGSDGATTPVRDLAAEYLSLAALVRRMRTAQRALRSTPSKGGWALCSGLEKLVDLRLSRVPLTAHVADVDAALDRVLLALAEADQLATPPAVEGGGL
ncbi:MAG: hypothetical protein JWO38_4904 [Gemmataceae bacterium]|nr:hypothetical protein [Gemmataceae bacterium]